MIARSVKSVYYLALKDMRAYYFKPPNISWGLLFPVAFSLAFYVRAPGDFRSLAPGLLALTALFGATSMEAIVITFEKRVGALERLLLAPISLPALLLGKLLGGAAFGFLTSLTVMLALVIILGIELARPLVTVVALATAAFTFAALGAFVSVSVKEIFEAQTLANFFRFPMLFLSGVFVPVAALPAPLQLVSRFLPLTYAVNAITLAIAGGDSAGLLLNTAVLALFGVGLFGLSTIVFKRQLD
jgi:ABC-2 type transport system permease protein